VAGIIVALVWSNADPDSYERCVGAGHDAWSITGDWTLMGHPITVHFVINDIFMVFFFGIAAKEVTESCLPGGSLNPPKKAFSPLFATIGGVSGPVLTYVVLCLAFWSTGSFDGYTLDASGSGSGSGSVTSGGSGGSSGSGQGAAEAVKLATILNGWGVPTATDISLAWMVAVQVFPFHHPAIDFLLLLAVADDAIGLIIIAVAYPNPDHAFNPVYLLLVLGGAVTCFILRRVFRMQHWSPYVILGGVMTWLGLIGAALHPALALCFVVPFMPSRPPISKPKQMPALHAFEHDLKLFVDLGMFAFTLANAGVRLQYVGALTWIILLSLIVGKIIGISFFVLATDACKLAPLNGEISKPADVMMVGSMAAIGLTVALFVSGEAFEDTRLQGEAKLGALLSGLMGAVCLGVSSLPCWKSNHAAFHAAHAETSSAKAADTAGGAPTVKRPKKQGAINVDEALYFKSAIRAGDAAFLVPRHVAEKAGILEMDHERAKRNWGLARQASRRIVPAVPAGDRMSSGPISQGTVVSLFQANSSSRLYTAAVPATKDPNANEVTALNLTEPPELEAIPMD